MRTRYSIATITPAALRPVTVDAMKLELSISEPDWDTKLELLIDEATAYLETATGRSICPATFAQYYDGLPAELYEIGGLELQRAPAIAVDAVKYIDADGVEQTWASSSYTLDAKREPARLAVSYDGTLPDPRIDLLSFWVQYQAGYVTVPALAKEFVFVYCRPRFERRAPTAEEIGRQHALVNALQFAP